MSVSEYELAGVETSGERELVDAVSRLGYDSVSDWIKALQDENNRKAGDQASNPPQDAR